MCSCTSDAAARGTKGFREMRGDQEEPPLPSPPATADEETKPPKTEQTLQESSQQHYSENILHFQTKAQRRVGFCWSGPQDSRLVLNPQTESDREQNWIGPRAEPQWVRTRWSGCGRSPALRWSVWRTSGPLWASAGLSSPGSRTAPRRTRVPAPGTCRGQRSAHRHGESKHTLSDLRFHLSGNTKKFKSFPKFQIYKRTLTRPLQLSDGLIFTWLNQSLSEKC